MTLSSNPKQDKIEKVKYAVLWETVVVQNEAYAEANVMLLDYRALDSNPLLSMSCWMYHAQQLLNA